MSGAVNPEPPVDLYEIERLLESAIKLGHVTKTADGKYELTEKGKEFLVADMETPSDSEH